ncbi:MAG: MarR family winged helix-turn-helix transcriptional regulator [Thermoleophilia bacterium]
MDSPVVKSQNVVSEILKLLPELGKALSTSVPDRVRHQGISNAQVRAVVHLAEYGPQTMGELAQGLRITTPSTTGLINPLAGMGLVQRERNDEDRRVVKVSLTEKARAMAGQVLAQRRREVEQALEGMDEEARLNFLEGLRRLAEIYDTDPEGVGSD